MVIEFMNNDFNIRECILNSQIGEKLNNYITVLDDLSNYMANNGYKHHLAITYGECRDIIIEAFSKYLGFILNSRQYLINLK